MRALLLLLIRIYQYTLSPWVGGSCRYWPTCSEYAREAIEEHGALRGSWLASRRLARCHPYGRGGYDPVPARAGAQPPDDETPASATGRPAAEHRRCEHA